MTQSANVPSFPGGLPASPRAPTAAASASPSSRAHEPNPRRQDLTSVELERAIAAFSNLLEIAGTGKPVELYEAQECLVAQYRRESKPFVATMPLRHLFTCPTCGLKRGEAAMHFEDPRQPLAASLHSERLFGMPAGRFAPTSRSVLHEALEHGQELRTDLEELFAKVMDA